MIIISRSSKISQSQTEDIFAFISRDISFYFLCKKYAVSAWIFLGGKSLNYIIVVFLVYLLIPLFNAAFQSDGGVFYFAYHLFMSCNLHTFITFQLKYKFIFFSPVCFLLVKAGTD